MKTGLFITNMLLAALASTASARTYDCDVTSQLRGGGTTDRMILSYDPVAGSGAVYDGIIHSIHKTPIPVDFNRESDTRVVWRWTLKNVEASRRERLTLSYIARINEKTDRLKVYVTFHGYDNEAVSSGTCKVIS